MSTKAVSDEQRTLTWGVTGMLLWAGKPAVVGSVRVTVSSCAGPELSFVCTRTQGNSLAETAEEEFGPSRSFCS